MFTVEEIKTAHTKVKSGADFPAYIRELKKMNVAWYETYVEDGRTTYYGPNNYQTTAAAKYDTLDVAEISNDQLFMSYLKAHQEGKSDFITFCKQAAETGVEKWVVRLPEMTCTYYDRKGNTLLVETIPN